MADLKITELTNDASPAMADLIVTVDDVAGTPTNKKVTLENLRTSLNTSGTGIYAGSGTVPTSTTATITDSLLFSSSGGDIGAGASVFGGNITDFWGAHRGVLSPGNLNEVVGGGDFSGLGFNDHTLFFGVVDPGGTLSNSLTYIQVDESGGSSTVTINPNVNHGTTGVSTINAAATTQTGSGASNASLSSSIQDGATGDATATLQAAVSSGTGTANAQVKAVGTAVGSSPVASLAVQGPADTVLAQLTPTVFFLGNSVAGTGFNLPLTDGTSNQVLATNGSGSVTWQDVSALGGGGTIDGSGAANEIAVFSDADTIGSSSDFAWDGSQFTVNGKTVSSNVVAISDGSGLTLNNLWLTNLSGNSAITSTSFLGNRFELVWDDTDSMSSPSGNYCLNNINSKISVDNTGYPSNALGISSEFKNNSTGAITEFTAYEAEVDGDAGSLGGTLADFYGYRIRNGVVNNVSTVLRGISIEDPNLENYFAGNMSLNGNVVINSSNGLDITPASDQNTELITLNVTGTPTLSWSEADDWFALSHTLKMTNVPIVFPDNHGIYDDTGNEMLVFRKTPTAVNYFEIYNAATTNYLIINAEGDDANINMELRPKGTGDVKIGNFVFDGDQTVGVGTDNYVMTYDSGSGLVSLEAATGGGASQLSDLSDVVSATNTNRFALMANGTTGYVGRALVEADISDLGTYLSNVLEDTTPQLGGVLDTNGNNIQFDDATGILDDSSNEHLIFNKTASAVNYHYMTNASVGTGTIMGNEGSDANIDFYIAPKGSGGLYVYNADPGSLGANMVLLHDSASPAISDVVGRVAFRGKDSGAATQAYGQIEVQIVSPTATSEEAKMVFAVTGNGTANVQQLALGDNTGASLATFGTGSDAATIESNGNFDLVLRTGNATTGSITLTDGANGDFTLATNGTGAVNVDAKLTFETAVGDVSALGNLGATEAIDWSSATHFTGTLDADVAITHTNEASGQKITLALSYDGTAQRTITWSDVDKWEGGSAPTAPSAAGEVLVVTLIFLGTTCYGSGAVFS